MGSPKGSLGADLPFWPQQVKAGPLQSSALVVAGGCFKEGKDFIVIEHCAFHKCCPLSLYSNPFYRRGIWPRQVK